MEKEKINEFVYRLKKISSCVISDATDKVGLKSSMNSSIKPIKLGTKLAGPAVTIRRIKKEKIGEGNFSQYTNILHEIIDTTEPGNIMLIDADGDTESATWGGNMSTAAKAKSLGGAIVDGGARDQKEIKDMDFPLFSKSTVPARSGGRLVTVGYNIPIVCGDILVHPGDFIMGDDDGVVVIPKNRIDEILTLAEEIEYKERKVLEYLKKGYKLKEKIKKFKIK